MEEQKHAEVQSNPSLYKRSYFSEKNNLNTRSISKFISVISFSIEITIKKYITKNGGHIKPGSTETTLILVIVLPSLNDKTM